YGRLKWISGTPQFLENPWSNTLAAPQPYQDLDTSSLYAPQESKPQSFFLARTGSRLMMAMVRNGHLWTCHHVGLNAQGGYSSSDPPSSLRSGCPWFNLLISSNGQSLTLADNNRVYDGSASYPYFYYMPSLMVNSAGDMV